MKEPITKFDLEAAFKALDEIDVPVASKVIANKPALTEIFSRKSKFDALMEEYYDISNMDELDDAKDAREAEVAQAKLARIEKIVDLDAESPEDLLPSYVGKFIMQCPQCMTLFYKDPEDVVASEEDPDTVNVSEVCQHCGNEAGYSLIGKVGEATQEEMSEVSEEETVDVTSTEEGEEDPAIDEPASEEDSVEDLDINLDELDLDIEEEEPEKAEEAFNAGVGEQVLVEQLTEESELDVSADEFEKLIDSPEFKKPISDNEARAMIDELSDDAEEEPVSESIELNHETLRYAVINADGTYAGVPCTSEEEARELAAQAEGRVIVELGALKEGVLDKIKDKFADTVDKITGKLKSRDAKADWVLANALEDYNNVKANAEGQLVPDEGNKRFTTFLVIGYKNKFSNGKAITAAPAFNNKDLVMGMDHPEAKKSYKNADDIAKGWSMSPGNGPAFIYLAKSPEDSNAVFLCEYFKGELENDQVEKYFKVVKDHLKGAKLMARGGMSHTEADDEAEEPTIEQRNEGLDSIMAGVDAVKAATLEKLVSESLIEAYGNVAGFKLTECAYSNTKFTVDGTIYFTSGNTRKTTYTFSEAFTGKDGEIQMVGLNEKLGSDRQFTITGRADDTKTFITESFKRTK